jgi:YqaJ-like viral recombinase domain
MERGLIVEADAVDWYEFDHDVTVQRVGFVTDDDHAVGCSPDRLIGQVIPAPWEAGAERFPCRYVSGGCRRMSRPKG